MLIAKEFVGYLSRRLVSRLNPSFIDTANPAALATQIADVIIADLEVEDKLNDEVREILEQYTEYMRREGVSYQDMFRKIKSTMVTQRKIIRAAGRESGDGMKLSRDKITDLSHQIGALLRKQRETRVKREPNETRLEIVKTFTEVLQTEEKADKDARTKVISQKKGILEGSEEYEILHKRYYAEELKKLGIELNA
ncbi:DUF507 family protein [Bryobacter aggregatus]|uniref:DUF507 family protein n=1 Tax=Bryobacter aggregatus TaxID=360054 RepID=UPI0004E0F958|nr:DUF507 family protein [Bryobacter aggregatus]